MYFKADRLEIHFLSTLPFPFYAFVTSAENMSPIPGSRAKKRSAAKSDENIIVEGERGIKAAQKDASATVAASSTGAAVDATEFWQRRIRPPSFLLLLSRRKMPLAVPQ